VFQQFKDKLLQLHWLKKVLLILIIVGIGFYLSVRFGWIQFKVKERDCTQVVKSDNAVAIKIENNKFDPDNLTANVCDTLLFLNLDETEHWPEGKSYPGFDAGHSLKKYDYFEFQVTRAGKYSFQDRLHQEITGKIDIKDIK